MKRFIGTIIALIVMLTFPIGTVYAYTWYSEDGGEASLTVEWGSPVNTIAEYTTHTLKLGVISDVYASATAKGSMYVDGWATTTGGLLAQFIITQEDILLLVASLLIYFMLQ